MQFGNIEGLVNGTEQIVFDFEVTGAAVSSISTGTQESNPVYSADITSIDYASVSSGAGDVAKTVDNNNANRWAAAPGSSHAGRSWVKQSFPTARAIRYWTFQQQGELGAQYGLTSVLFQYSDDDTNWTTAATQTVANSTAIQGFYLANNGAHRYWRILANADVAGGGVSYEWMVNEIEMMEMTSSSGLPIINGDEDGWYTIIVRGVQGADSAIGMRLNGDSGANYGNRAILASSTSVSDDSGTGATYTWIGGSTTNYSFLCMAKIYAKSGSVRIINATTAYEINGTTVTNLYNNASVWNNTADNITSINFFAGASNGLGVGTRIIILKSNNFTNGTQTGAIRTPYIKGSWVRVGSQVLGSAASTVTFSGLNGDRDVLYYLSYSRIATGTSGGNCLLSCNSDTGTNYGFQLLSGSDTTVAGARNTSIAGIIGCATGLNPGQYGTNSTILFSKSGFIRPALVSSIDAVSGTTVTKVHFSGVSWNNTTDNITTLTITESANGFGAGSMFDLYALRPNG